MSKVSIVHEHPQESFKLLELSPELIKHLSSNNDGRRPRLYLKSPSDAPSQVRMAPQPARSPAGDMFVNLCTDDQTFFLRQVSSSNSTLLIRPQTTCAEPDARGNIEPSSGIAHTCSIIASCKGQLEIAGLPKSYDGRPFLLKMLEPWEYDELRAVNEEPPADCNGRDELLVSKRCRVVENLFNDLPLSTAECIRHWIALCAFVHGGRTGGHKDSYALHCYRPTARARLAIWRAIIEASILASIDISKEFLVSDLWLALSSGDLGQPSLPRPAFDAVVRRCCTAWCSSVTYLCQKTEWAKFGREATVAWTGSTLLEASSPGMVSAMQIDDLVGQWQDLLPETWRRDVTPDKLRAQLRTRR